METTLVPVPVTCPCPGTPHADGGDTVYLFPKMGLGGGIVAEKQVRELAGGDQDLILAQLTETFVLYGVASWTFVDDVGEPIEVSEQTKRAILLSDYTLARDIGEKADELYASAVIDPLVRRLSAGSQPQPTNDSMSRKKRSGSSPRKSPKSSSTSTSQTAATATITS